MAGDTSWFILSSYPRIYLSGLQMTSVRTHGNLILTVTLLICIQEVPASNTGWDINYYNWSFFVIFVSNSSQMPDSALKYSTTASFHILYNSLTVYHSTQFFEVVVTSTREAQTILWVFSLGSRVEKLLITKREHSAFDLDLPFNRVCKALI
jgi:hypothetical protein